MTSHDESNLRPQRCPARRTPPGPRPATLWLGLLLLAALVPAPLLAPAPVARAQTPRGLRVAYTSPDGEPRQGLADGAPLYAASHAVVVGIDAYEHLPRLRAAVADARVVAEELTRRGMEVQLLVDGEATRERLASLLGDRLPQVVGPEDRVVVYFAGHGVSTGRGEQAMGYLMPAGGRRESLRATGISMAELQTWLAGYPSKHVLFVADACYSGLALSTRSVGMPSQVADYLRQVTSRRVRLALVAGGAGEEATEWQGQGVFTRFFLDGIRGAADGNGDGAVTSDELAAYVKPEVAQFTASHTGAGQHPQLGRRGEGEFVFLNPRVLASRAEASRPVAPPSPAPGPAPPDLSGYTAAPDQAERARVQQDAERRPPQVAVPEGFVRIPAGRFMMGSPENEPGRNDDERQHEVIITRPFLLQATEVTRGQWERLMATSPSSLDSCGDECPLGKVNWWEALAYCNAASQAEGLPECYELVGCDEKRPGEGMECKQVRFAGLGCHGYRLPTEAEWEYAARAGTRTPFSTGRCLPTEQANYDGNAPPAGCPKGDYRRQPVAVGSFSANAWGLHDMHGNAYEWCWDWHGAYPSGQVRDPLGPRTGSVRAARGGSWSTNAGYARSSNRGAGGPGARSNNLGLRPARSSPGS